MLSHFSLSRVINLVVTLILLGMVGNPTQTSQSSETGNVIEGFSGNQVSDGVNGGRATTPCRRIALPLTNSCIRTPPNQDFVALRS